MTVAQTRQSMLSDEETRFQGAFQAMKRRKLVSHNSSFPDNAVGKGNFISSVSWHLGEFHPTVKKRTGSF